jgi:hypothetical protein
MAGLRIRNCCIAGLFGNLEFLDHTEVSMSDPLVSRVPIGCNWHCAVKNIPAGRERFARPDNAVNVLAVEHSLSRYLAIAASPGEIA